MTTREQVFYYVKRLVNRYLRRNILGIELIKAKTSAKLIYIRKVCRNCYCREDMFWWEINNYGFWTTYRQGANPSICPCGIYHSDEEMYVRWRRLTTRILLAKRPNEVSNLHQQRDLNCFHYYSNLRTGLYTILKKNYSINPNILKNISLKFFFWLPQL